MFISKSPKIPKIIVSSFVLLFLFSSHLFAQNNRHDEPISEELYGILEKRKEFIQQEVSTNKNEWSGTYTQGDHHPTVFMWSANRGFLTWGSHHTFFPSRINFGKAEFLNNRLTIKPEISKEHLNFQYIPTELSAIKWDEQHFLIPSDRLINFAYAVHSGADSRIVEYFTKSEDYQKSRKGLPNLPKEFGKVLTMKAIKSRITAVKITDDRIFDAEITLNLGRADKLIEGMIFYHVKSSGSISIVITDLQEKSSKAEVVGISGSVENEIKPRIGLKFTSKIPDGYYDY